MPAVMDMATGMAMAGMAGMADMVDMVAMDTAMVDPKRQRIIFNCLLQGSSKSPFRKCLIVLCTSIMAELEDNNSSEINNSAGRLMF